jgi:hypothetical protein
VKKGVSPLFFSDLAYAVVNLCWREVSAVKIFVGMLSGAKDWGGGFGAGFRGLRVHYRLRQVQRSVSEFDQVAVRGNIFVRC